MVKTTVYLDNDTVLELKSIAERKNRPQAELIRDALRKYTQSHKPPHPKARKPFRSGRGDISSNYRQMLKRAVREGQWP